MNGFLPSRNLRDATGQAPSFQNLLLVLGARNLFVDLLIGLIHEAEKIITFFSDSDVTVRIKGFSRY